jgi:hypothetical protein
MESIGVIDSVARNALTHRCFSSPHFLATFLLRRTSHNKTSNGHQHKKMEPKNGTSDAQGHGHMVRTHWSHDCDSLSLGRCSPTIGSGTVTGGRR